MRRLVDNREQLEKFINGRITPKTYEQKKFSEVFTPLDKIEIMLDLLPVQVWSNPNLTWYEPSAGIGNFSVCIFFRLMKGLKGVVKNTADHIIQKMIFMCELNSENVSVIKSIFGESVNLYVGDALERDDKRYDIVLGNPPYSTDMENQGRIPLYNLFVEKFIDNCTYLLFVIPSRWFASGKGLNSFRKSMLSRRDIKVLNHVNNASEWFGNKVNIKGGISYFIKDSSYQGDTLFNGVMYNLSVLDVIVDPKYFTLITEVNNLIHRKGLRTLADIYKSSGFFKVETNDSRLSHNKDRVVCYVSEKQSKQRVMYLKALDYQKFWKVITPVATQGANSGFGFKTILNPDEVYSKSYVSFMVKNKTEAESLLSYLNCELPNKLLSIRKISQQVNKSLCVWIPLLPLDRVWTDEKIKQFIGFSVNDILEKS